MKQASILAWQKHRLKRDIAIIKGSSENTELSKYMWDLTKEQKNKTMEWSIVRKIYGKTKSDFCKLCLSEKYFILNALGNNKLLKKKF